MKGVVCIRARVRSIVKHRHCIIIKRCIFFACLKKIIGLVKQKNANKCCCYFDGKKSFSISCKMSRFFSKAHEAKKWTKKCKFSQVSHTTVSKKCHTRKKCVFDLSFLIRHYIQRYYKKTRGIILIKQHSLNWSSLYWDRS